MSARSAGAWRWWTGLALLMVCALAQAQIQTLSEAINKAGRQRMLTQRMLKSHVMIGLQVQPVEARQQLRQAVMLFDRQLAELRDFAPTPQIGQSLQRVTALWLPFRKRILAAPDRATVQSLLEPNDELLRAAHKVVLMLEDVAGTASGRLVNVAGRQRMLTQRLARFYMLRAWGIDTAAVRSEASRAENEFQGALAELRAAPGNTRQIDEALKEARVQWDLFKHALDRRGKNFIPLLVAMTSEKLLQTMDRITGLYQELAE